MTPERAAAEPRASPREPPSLSVVIAAFLSHRTIDRSLEHLARQTLEPREIVVCDSSPDDRTARIVERHPGVRLLRSERRLLPQQARRVGVDATSGELLLFTDPDVYAAPDWIERLVALHLDRGAAVVGGALACWDRDWLNRGIHVCKFARWLPGGEVRTVDNVPTASLLIARALYHRLGGFDDPLYGDAQLSRLAAEHGPVLLEPAAVAQHDHAMRLGSFARERFRRGLRVGAAERPGRARLLARLAITVLPIRLAHSLSVAFDDCRRGPGLGTWARALPVVAFGQAASLLGEARGMGTALLDRPARTTPAAG